MADSIRMRMDSVGFTRGFDYLRLILAFGVVAWHSIYISGDSAASSIVLGDVIGPFKAAILPMFFSLSGFLVCGSIFRSASLEGFVTLRAIRIMPALAVEVLLSALLLGPLVSNYSMQAYFTDPKFWIYLQNLVGHVQFLLPGVFENNPRPDIVNLSLWTVPFELICYLSLIILAFLGLHHQRWRFAAISVLATIALCAAYIVHGSAPPKAFTMTLPGHALVLSFLLGCSIHLLRNEIRLSKKIALVCAISAFVFLSFPKSMILAIIPLAYLTIWLGLLHPPKIPVLMDGDYSYGVYLFAYPIQQTLAMSEMFRPWHVNLGITSVLALLYAAFSWHMVEKPILARKAYFVSRVETFGSQIRRVTAKSG